MILEAKIDEESMKTGYLCDPNAKSDLRIVARPGVVIRLTRNFDKARGFVNGALAVVCESLRGNAVFTARLLGTGNMVLLHPMMEDGAVLLWVCHNHPSCTGRRSAPWLYLFRPEEEGCCKRVWLCGVQSLQIPPRMLLVWQASAERFSASGGRPGGRSAGAGV